MASESNKLAWIECVIKWDGKVEFEREGIPSYGKTMAPTQTMWGVRNERSTILLELNIQCDHFIQGRKA